jgi:hypothetical protein
MPAVDRNLFIFNSKNLIVRKFIFKILLFFSALLFIFFIGIFLPATPRASKSLLFAKIAKDSLMENVPSPRVIFVGGSNLSFGLNSQMIKDSLGLNPINTAIHANLGIEYMLDNSLNYIKAGDKIIVAFEYYLYYDHYAYGNEELLRMILDVSPDGIMELRKEQWANIYSFLPKYSFSKFKPTEYFNFIKPKQFLTFTNRIYSVTSFNEYGDAVGHWELEKENFEPFGLIGESFNHAVITELLNYNKKLEQRGAVLYITFPGYQATSYENSKAEIIEVEAELKKNNFVLLGNPERYKIPDSLMFNTPYHLVKEAIDLRTMLLIEDLKTVSQ